MKKILLSVIALFVAVSMNAEPYKVAVDDGHFNLNQTESAKWGGVWYDWEAAGTKGDFDASAYEYVWIKFSGNTGKFCGNCGQPQPAAAPAACPKCGFKPADGVMPKFCPECGTKIE